MRKLFALVAVASACTGSDPRSVDIPADAGSAPPTVGPDASPEPDAGADSGPGHWCASHADADYCEDFDTAETEANITPGSNQPDLPKGTLSALTFSSSPKSFLFEMPPGRAPVQSTYLPRAFSTAKSTIRFELGLRIAAAAPSDGQAVQVLVLKRYTAEAQLIRYCNANDAGAVDCRWEVASCVAGICRGHPMAVAPKALTEWSRVALEATFADEGHVKFEQDGIVLVDENDPLFDPATPMSEPTSATAAIAVVGGTSSSWSVYVDDLLVTLR